MLLLRKDLKDTVDIDKHEIFCLQNKLETNLFCQNNNQGQIKLKNPITNSNLNVDNTQDENTKKSNLKDFVLPNFNFTRSQKTKYSKRSDFIDINQNNNNIQNFNQNNNNVLDFNNINNNINNNNISDGEKFPFL